MSGLLSPCMCSVMSVVLLFSILTTACSISPTALTLRSCTRQPNGEQLVSKSITQSFISINQSNEKASSDCIYMWSVESWWRHFVHSLDPVYRFSYLLGYSFFHIIHFNSCRMPSLKLPHPASFLWRPRWPAVQRHHVRTHAHHSAREAVVQEWTFCRNRGTRETKFLAESNLSTGAMIDPLIVYINVISL